MRRAARRARCLRRGTRSPVSASPDKPNSRTPRKVKLSRSSHSRKAIDSASRAGGMLAGADSSAADGRLDGLQHRLPVQPPPPASRRRIAETAAAEIGCSRLRTGLAGGWRCSSPGGRRSSAVARSSDRLAAGPARSRLVLKIGCCSNPICSPRACTSPSTESTRNGMSSLRISSTVDAGSPSAALAAARRKPTLCRPFGFSAMNSNASRALRASRAGVMAFDPVAAVAAVQQSGEIRRHASSAPRIFCTWRISPLPSVLASSAMVRSVLPPLGARRLEPPAGN